MATNAAKDCSRNPPLGTVPEGRRALDCSPRQSCQSRSSSRMASKRSGRPTRCRRESEADTLVTQPTVVVVHIMRNAHHVSGGEGGHFTRELFHLVLGQIGAGLHELCPLALAQGLPKAPERLERDEYLRPFAYGHVRPRRP